MDMIEIAERLAATEHDVQALKDWQQKQNGSLQRLEEKMDSIQKWLIGLLGGVITSLILLIVNMSLGR